MTRPRGAWLAAASSVAGFVAAFYLRLSAAYGPFNLTWHAADWTVLWELLRHGQIASRLVLEGAVLGAGAAAVPWAIFALWVRRRRTP